jgi:hypothetical protein
MKFKFLKSSGLFLLLSLLSLTARAEEVSLFDSHGAPVAYAADDFTVFMWDGDAVAYLSGADDRYSIYAFNGTHLGWFIHGLVYDHAGNIVGFAGDNYAGVRAGVEPAKGTKGHVPDKLTKEFARAEPVPTNQWSAIGLEALLRNDPQ